MVSTGRGAPPDNPKGGVENEAYLLVNSIAKHLRSVHYVESLGNASLPENVLVYNVASSQHYFPTFMTELLTAPILALRVADVAKQALIKCPIDVVHFHETRGNLPIHLLSGFKNLPKILSIHGPIPWTVKYDSKVETFVRVNTYRVFDIGAFKKVDHLIAISSWIKKNLIKLGMPDEKISVVYNPIDTAFFSPKRKLEKRSKDVLDKFCLEPSSYYLTVGSLVSRKRHLDLIRAFASYKGEKKLVIVGNGPEFSNVDRLISKYNLNNRIRVIRHVDASLLPYLYASAYVFVTCSMAEGLPVAVMEAMSSGLGIISPNAPWIEELVGQNNGVLFNPSCTEATTDAFNLFDEVSSKRFGSISRNIAERLFSSQACATKTLKIYESVTN
jgi:glycosyltransferase involved in cell wall biosynthesis